MRRCAIALFGQRARLRWLHLILGGALFMPYWLVGTIVLGAFLDSPGMFGGSVAVQFGAYAIGLPLAAVTALFPLARPMSVAVARALCGIPADRLADGPARGRDAKARTAGWFTLHVGAGALISGASLALPPFAVSVAGLPFWPALRESEVGRYWGLDRPWMLWAALPAGLLMLLALAATAAASCTTRSATPSARSPSRRARPAGSSTRATRPTWSSSGRR